MKLSSFLLKASFLDHRYKSLNNLAKEVAVLLTKQAVRYLCIKVADHKAASSAQSSTLPSLPVAAAVKEEPQHDDPLYSSSQEPKMKKIKIEAEDYDDWLDDVIYVKTEKDKIQSSTYELINQELEKYDAEPQIRGDPLLWWKARQASMPILSEVARAILCVPGSPVPSERVFSKSGQLLNKKRASLKSKNVDMLIFLNKNYSFKHLSK